MNNLDFKTLEKNQLISILEHLYQNEEIAEKIHQLMSNHNQVLEEYKKKMDEMFFPIMGMPISNLSISDALIEEYHAQTIDDSYEFEMYYLEMLLEFIKTYGMMSPSFYEKMIGIFEQISLCDQNKSYSSRLSFVQRNMTYISPKYARIMSELLKNLDDCQ